MIGNSDDSRSDNGDGNGSSPFYCLLVAGGALCGFASAAAVGFSAAISAASIAAVAGITAFAAAGGACAASKTDPKQEGENYLDERDKQRRQHQQTQAEEKVSKFLQEHPDWSAKEVLNALESTPKKAQRALSSGDFNVLGNLRELADINQQEGRMFLAALKERITKEPPPSKPRPGGAVRVI